MIPSTMSKYRVRKSDNLGFLVLSVSKMSEGPITFGSLCPLKVINVTKQNYMSQWQNKC